MIMGDIRKAVEWAVAIAEDNTHGYAQDQRNGPDYDCSSFVSTALSKAGFHISPYSWTGNMVDQLKADGFYEVPVNGERKAGDIFIHEENHVIMCIDSQHIVMASINEHGGVRGGQPGDQTGREIYILNFYTPSYGWQYHLRAPDPPQDKPAVKTLLITWGD